MVLFNSYRLIKEEDGYSVIVYIDDSLTEFAEDLIDSSSKNKDDFNTDLKNSLTKLFPDIKINTVKVMYRALLISFFIYNSIGSTAFAASEIPPTTSTPGSIRDAVHFMKRGSKFWLISKLYKASLNPIRKVYYIVKPGDSLSSIAKANNTTIEEIKNINNFTSDIIFTNQRIKLPSNSLSSGYALYSSSNPYLHLVSLHKNLFPTPVAYNFSIPTTNLWLPATDEQIDFYINPNNFINDPYGKFQFLQLNYTSGITSEDLNTLLKGKGVLEGKGAIFLQAAITYNISPIYLVSHALLETGNGSTALSNGIFVTQVDGKSVSPNLVYNMFGIGAYDINANKYGSEYAYKQGWFSVEEAITGGAKWISSQYINNIFYNQNTLYKMRWNPSNPGTHQYSTDVAWAYNQTYNIKRLADKLPNANLVFDIPK